MYKEEHRKEKQREAQRKYRERHAENLKAKRDAVRESGEMKEYWREKTKRNRQKNKELYKSLDTRWYHNAKDRAFDILGGKCASCGWTDPRALQVDHVVAIGDAERRRLGHRGRKLYQAVVKNPTMFQLLCANCNWIKRHDKGERFCNIQPSIHATPQLDDSKLAIGSGRNN